MDMLERLLPSEVARLVLGYLKTESCNSAFKAFLGECPHLKEYAMLLERGREYTTKVNGRTLEEYLDEFADLKKAVSTKTSLTQHYVSGDGQVRRLVLDTPAEGGKNVAPGSAFIVNDASPGPYAKNEVPNPCFPKKTINLEKKTKRSRSKKASRQTTSLLEDAWKAVSQAGKSGTDSRLSSANNTVSSVRESRSSKTIVNDTNCESRTRPKTKNLVKKILFESNEDDSCKQCTKNQSGRTDRSSRRSRSDFAHGLKQRWESTVVASASSKNEQAIPRVRLKIANSCQAAAVTSDEDENFGMETGYDAPEFDGDVDVDGGRCNNQETGSSMGEENDNCDTRETASPKPSTSAELPRRHQTPVKMMEPLTLEIPEVSEEPPGLHTPFKNVDVQSMMSTPSKFNDTASVISVGRSPKRKSHAPKRRFNKPPVSRPAAAPSFMNDESLYSFPFPIDDPVSVDMSSIVKNLLENTHLQEKLADNINQVVASHHPVSTTQVAPEPCAVETVKHQQSLENFLGTKESFVNEHVNEQTIGGIVELTKDDPAFDALFSLFNVEKDVFLENRRKQQMTEAPPENHCDVNGNLKARSPELAGKDLSGENTLLDRLDAMVSLADDTAASSSLNQQGTNLKNFDTSTEGCDAEVVYVLNLSNPQSEIVVQSEVSQFVTYAVMDQPDNAFIERVNIGSVSEEKMVSGSLGKFQNSPVQRNRNTQSSETHDLNKSGVANSSDESVRHFSRELMDLKSPYISHTNSPAPIDVEAPCENQAVPKKVQSDGAEASPHTTVPNSSPATNPLNTSMEFRPCSDQEDNHVDEVHCGETAQETRSLSKVPQISPRKRGAGDGLSLDSGMQWKMEVLEMRPAPANVECIEFASASFESEHSKNADEVRLSTKDTSFTKPQTVGHNSTKPRRVPLTTLSSVPSPFLPGPFSPQTPMMPHTPSHGMPSPSQSPRETSAPFSSFSSQSTSPRTMAHGCPFVTSPALEVEVSTSKPTALSPAPSLYTRQIDSPRTAKSCPSPSPASQFPPKCFSTSVPSPFMCHPVSPRTPGLVPPASPMIKEGLSLKEGRSPLCPVTTESDPEQLKDSSSSTEPTSVDPGEVLSMTAEFSPSQPLSTSSPATPIRNKKAVTSNVPFMVNRTPDKAVAGIKLVASTASPNLSEAVQRVMTSRMTPDKLAAASNHLLKMQSTTPDKQVHITPRKEQTLDNHLTPNKGPPSVGSCCSTHSPYSALRMTPVQTTDQDYSQHQNLAVASILSTPQKVSKHSSDDEKDISNESDETCMSVATVVREEQRQAVDAILWPSPAKSTCATPQKLFYRSRGTPVKSHSPSPNSSPQNFTQIVSKEHPVVFKIPNVEKDCPSPLKNNENDNQSQKNVIGYENVQTLSESVQTCEVIETGQDVPSPSRHSSVVQSKGKGGLVRMQISSGKRESENSGFELNHSNSTGLPSDGDAPMSDQQHTVMMESLSSETISAFQAYAESIPGVERTTVSGETTQINITTNFGLLPHNQPASCPTSQSLNTSSGQIASAHVATSACQEIPSAFTQQELDDERALLAEVHSTLASMPPLPNDQTTGSTTPVASSQNEDIPLSAGALMGFSAAQEQIFSTPVSEPNTAFVQSPQYQQGGSKKKKTHSRTSSVSEIGTPPAPSYQVPIPSSINLQDPGVRVIQVKTQKGNVIPIFLTPLDSFDQSTPGEQQLSSDQGSSLPMKVIPVEVKDIASPEARMLLQDNSQSFDTMFGNADTSGRASFIGNLLSSQKDNATSNEAVKANTEQVAASETAGQALIDPSVALVSESGSSVNTSPDMALVKGSGSHQEGMSTEGCVELSKIGNRRKRKKKSRKSEREAKKRRTESVPVDDCDNVELLDFLQAHPVGDLCKKTISPLSPHPSVTGSPVKTPAKVENYKFCSPAPVGDQTQDGVSSMWHDIVNIDLGEQTKIMADITRPLSELLKTPTKSVTYPSRGTPSRSQHSVTQVGQLAALLKTPTKPDACHSHGAAKGQQEGTPSILNCESNPSLDLSPMRGKLRPILESCSIIDNHVVASPTMSLGPDSDIDADEFLQRLPERTRNVAKTTKLNKQPRHSSISQSQPKFPSSSAAAVVAVESTKPSQIPPKETSTSPIELAAAESGIFPNESTGNQESYPNDQVSCSRVRTPSVEIAPVNAPAVSKSFSVQSAPVNMPINSSICSMNLPTIQPAQPVQSSVILVQLLNGQYAVLPTSSLTPAAPVVMTPAATTAEPVRWKRKYKKRKKKSPSQSSKKTTPPAVPVQNVTLPAMNQVVQAPQISNFSQPNPSMPQFLVNLPQPTAQPTLTQPAPVVVQQVSSTLPAHCSTQPVPLGQPVPRVARLAAVNEPNQSMMSPTDLVIAETPPYIPEHEQEEWIRNISPSLEALVRIASPKIDTSKQPKTSRPTKASARDRRSTSHSQSRKTAPEISEISPRKRTGIAQRNTFSPLVAAAMEYQQRKKKELQSPARDVPLADADVSMDMPSEDIFLGLEGDEQSPVKKSVEAFENTSKHSTSSRVSKAPLSSSTDSGVKLTGAKSKIVSKERKSKKESKRKTKESKPDLTSPVLPPESVISNMQGSQNEVVLCIPNDATPTIDTEMFSALLNDDSEVDNEKERGKAAKRGRRTQKRRSSSKHRSRPETVSSVQTTATRMVSPESPRKVASPLEKGNVLKSSDLTELPPSKAKEGPGQPKRHLPKVSATLQKKSLPGVKQARQEKSKAKPHVRVLHFNEFDRESTTASKSKSSRETVQPRTTVDQDLYEVIQEKGTSDGVSNTTVFRDPKLNARVEIHVPRLGKDKNGCITDENNSDSDDLGPLPIPRRRSSKAEKTLNVPEVAQTLEVEKLGSVLKDSSFIQSCPVTKSDKHSRDDKAVSSQSTPEDTGWSSSYKTKDKVTASISKLWDKIASGTFKSKDEVTASSLKTKDKVTSCSSRLKDRISGSSSKEHGLGSKSLKRMKAKKSKKKGVVELDRKTLDALCKAAGLDLGKFVPDSSSDQDDEGETSKAEDSANVEIDSESENEQGGDGRSNFLLDLKTPAEKDVKNRMSVEKDARWLPGEEEEDGHTCDNGNMSDNSFSSMISAPPNVDLESTRKQTSCTEAVSIGELQNQSACNSSEKVSFKKLSVREKGEIVGKKSPGVRKRSSKSDSARTLVKKSEQKVGDKCQTSAKKSVRKVHVNATDTESVEASCNHSTGRRVAGNEATKVHLDAVLDSVVRSNDSECFRVVYSPKKSKMQLSSLEDVFNSVIVTSPENQMREKVQGSVYRIPADLVSKFRHKTSSSKSAKSSKSTAKLPVKNVSISQSNSAFKPDSVRSCANSSKKSALPENSGRNSASQKTSHGQTSDAILDNKLPKSSKTKSSVTHASKSDTKCVEHSSKSSDAFETVTHSSDRMTKPSPRSQIRMDFEEIFGDESPAKNSQKGGKYVPSSSHSQRKPLPRKSPRKRTVTSVTVPSSSTSPKRGQAKKSPKKKAHKISRLVTSSKSKSKKDLMKVKIPHLKIVTNEVHATPEDSTSVLPDESTPKVYSPQMTPEKYFPIDISPDRSPETVIKSEIDSDEDMEINAAETLVSMAMSITPQKSLSASNSRSPGLLVNVYTTPQKEDNLDSSLDYLPDLGFSSTATSQPVFPSSTQTLPTTCRGVFAFDDKQSGLVFKTPEKPQMPETTRKTPRKGTPRKLLVMNQDPLSDLKKKDRDLFEKKVPKSPAKVVKVKTSMKPGVKRLSPRKHSKGKTHQ
ncbi:mucin-2-like [Lineus longissimus]|uniref:mucin-2-like n=1 Tax=Lineus longissimus TaxID=88925 RepID=UPI00315CFFB6